MINKRILALFSGGLDSIIAVLWMQKLGFEVIPIFFETPFFKPDKAIKIANENMLTLTTIDFSAEHLDMLKSPVYGYGKHFNPCIDCHGLMFRILKDKLVEYKAAFIISGEVLNQRPMSQRKDAMNAVKKLSTIGDLIVRPLSQRLLSDTLPVREGWVNKVDLLDISGRSRARQLAIAQEFGVKEIPQSGGGCLLTDKGYTTRLKELIDYNQLTLKNINFLESGRHFRLSSDIKVIINRQSSELTHLLSVITDETILKCQNVPGPIGILNSPLPIHQGIIELAGSILLRYCPKAKEIETINFGKQFNLNESMVCTKLPDPEIDKYRII
ncbi:MAG: tRNA (5-methylaminomethyl-2-thiouridylate)-methyltransferase [Candidatus Cloacimonetes bacterium]|nr:tRNA (5-methylaminomethyl-2-thiouridylate)-methyltransferase [Candidatus Cloacimonadota bacterium]